VEPLRPTDAQSTLAELGDELDRIAGAVAAGNHDLRALGFWRVVGRIKRDQLAIVRYADEVARITADLPGTTRDYWIYVPVQYRPDKPACV